MYDTLFSHHFRGEYMEIINERLRELREKKGDKQQDIALKLGITQQIYSNYEIGKNDLPLRHLLRLADYYGVSTDYLLGRSSYPKLPPVLSASFIQNVSVESFLCRIVSFSDNSKRQLVEYVNYLTYLENSKKKQDPPL